jgi:hypothetical protein
LDRLPWEGFYTAAQLRRWLAAIPARFSCRAFAGPSDIAQAAALAYAASRVSFRGVHIEVTRKNAESLIVPVPFFPRFSGVSEYAAVYADPDLPLARLLCGMAGEALNLEAVGMGLQGCWMTGNFRRGAVPPSANAAEKLMGIIVLGQPAPGADKGERKRRPLPVFTQDDPAKWPHWAYAAGEAMRAAPSAMNRQPWKLDFTGRTLSYAGALDGIDSGIALMHLECAAHAHPRRWRVNGAGSAYNLIVETPDDAV